MFYLIQLKFYYLKQAQCRKFLTFNNQKNRIKKIKSLIRIFLNNSKQIKVFIKVLIKTMFMKILIKTVFMKIIIKTVFMKILIKTMLSMKIIKTVFMKIIKTVFMKIIIKTVFKISK
ncbi:hypothetical protein IMG5_120690 [Ichthyophthirius multifiliis]|uniref:Uncharacterized protein n=1 Tax=Ichthyophthirius multifiliis TaxID=5932 RepID=G0QV12_ICHMU|nr:hypothetical protein IMG5_120690 [Ichthyophthirius multifiliis]EGR30937.1 hypothetical protein IMG5_120690 [Ichthyophthirius multifiliis]|eukprot:XP_004032524.1 hypothetical protein IMG5_120690 [Ichthyophthirius multifiliis]